MTKNKIEDIIENLDILNNKIEDTEIELNFLRAIRESLKNELFDDWTEEELMRPVL